MEKEEEIFRVNKYKWVLKIYIYMEYKLIKHEIELIETLKSLGFKLKMLRGDSQNQVIIEFLF